MYKILIMILVSIHLFAYTETETYFHVNKKLKQEQVISKLKGMALVINKDNNQTNHIKFWEEKNKKIKIFISSKIQKEYPSILEGLEPIKIKSKKNKKSTAKTTFYISKEIEKKYPELIKLIKETESMDDDERQYWFDIMPSMTNSQINRLYNILNVEKRKLQELEIKYQKEIKTLNEKNLNEWEEFQLKKKQEKELNTTTTNYDDMIEKIEVLEEN